LANDGLMACLVFLAVLVFFAAAK